MFPTASAPTLPFLSEQRTFLHITHGIRQHAKKPCAAWEYEASTSHRSTHPHPLLLLCFLYLKTDSIQGV